MEAALAKKIIPAKGLHYEGIGYTRISVPFEANWRNFLVELGISLDYIKGKYGLEHEVVFMTCSMNGEKVNRNDDYTIELSITAQSYSLFIDQKFKSTKGNGFHLFAHHLVVRLKDGYNQPRLPDEIRDKLNEVGLGAS